MTEADKAERERLLANLKYTFKCAKCGHEDVEPFMRFVDPSSGENRCGWCRVTPAQIEENDPCHPNQQPKPA